MLMPGPDGHVGLFTQNTRIAQRKHGRVFMFTGDIDEL